MAAAWSGGWVGAIGVPRFMESALDVRWEAAEIPVLHPSGERAVAFGTRAIGDDVRSGETRGGNVLGVAAAPLGEGGAGGKRGLGRKVRENEQEHDIASEGTGLHHVIEV